MDIKGESVLKIFTENQALIAKQAEQIKMLRSELENFIPYIIYHEDGTEEDLGGSFNYDEGSEHMGLSVIAVLEATKEQA